ncbi:hypothetical protein F2P81_019462 [Scophthalmus maximus]|uniref:Uncharacterized protein n=1 Tax=Scophthalmus maximus TaxID=52904 RepID=A0A6A4S7W5_SCOMX|nr:hypothetical protein F2P81_019462 [Scophthalmus maximus]
MPWKRIEDVCDCSIFNTWAVSLRLADLNESGSRVCRLASVLIASSVLTRRPQLRRHPTVFKVYTARSERNVRTAGYTMCSGRLVNGCGMKCARRVRYSKECTSWNRNSP